MDTLADMAGAIYHTIMRGLHVPELPQLGTMFNSPSLMSVYFVMPGNVEKGRGAPLLVGVSNIAEAGKHLRINFRARAGDGDLFGPLDESCFSVLMPMRDVGSHTSASEGVLGYVQLEWPPSYEAPAHDRVMEVVAELAELVTPHARSCMQALMPCLLLLAPGGCQCAGGPASPQAPRASCGGGPTDGGAGWAPPPDSALATAGSARPWDDSSFSSACAAPSARRLSFSSSFGSICSMTDTCSSPSSKMSMSGRLSMLGLHFMDPGMEAAFREERDLTYTNWRFQPDLVLLLLLGSCLLVYRMVFGGVSLCVTATFLAINAMLAILCKKYHLHRDALSFAVFVFIRLTEMGSLIRSPGLAMPGAALMLRWVAAVLLVQAGHSTGYSERFHTLTVAGCVATTAMALSDVGWPTILVAMTVADVLLLAVMCAGERRARLAFAARSALSTPS